MKKISTWLLAVALSGFAALSSGCAEWHKYPLDTPLAVDERGNYNASSRSGHGSGGSSGAAVFEQEQPSGLHTPLPAQRGGAFADGSGAGMPPAGNGTGYASSGPLAGNTPSGGSDANYPPAFSGTSGGSGMNAGMRGGAGASGALAESLASVRLYFDFNKWNLKPASYASLSQVGQILRANPGLRIRIGGHCDAPGSEEYNYALGERRARAAYSALVQSGVNPAQLEMVSYGEAFPAVPKRGREPRNRRDEFIVLAPW